MTVPNRDQIKIGIRVSIETKENQGSGRLTEGTVKNILTASNTHPHGIKAELEDGSVGRVKQIIGETTEETIQKSTGERFEDLMKIEIPKTEDEKNEFKEFYQYDKKLADMDNIQASDGIKRTTQERFATAVCGFGNSYEGGFVYLGIKSDGSISGLEKDLKLGEFSDYNDSFANHIIDKLEDFLKDRVFLVSKLRIKFREIDDKTICIVQVLPADRPVYLHSKLKTFFVRAATPKTIKFNEDEQFKYIKKRFPNYQ